MAAGGGGGGGGGDSDSSSSDDGHSPRDPRRNPLGPPPDGSPRRVPVDVIRACWAELEALIAQFVSDCLAPSLPLNCIITNREEFNQYESYCFPSDIAYWMLVSPEYAKYMFQARIWNLLDESIFQWNSTLWAANDMFEADVELGAGAAMNNITGSRIISELRCRTQSRKLTTSHR